MDFFDSKRGSHVGFAISFIIFVSFIVFLLNIVGPTLSVQSDKNSLAESVQGEIIKNSSSVLMSVSVLPEYKRPSENCVDVSGLEKEDNFMAKGSKGKILDSNSTHFKSGSENLTKFYSSNESLYSSGSVSCSNATSSYELGLSKSEKFVFEDKVENLISNYSSDYEDLKSSFDVPEGNDFEFVFVSNNGTRKNATLNQNVQTEVFAVSEPVTYVDKNATKKQGSLETRVW